MRLTVIIVNYNVKYFLEQCLCSVLKACGGIDAEVLVVDNASADGSRAFLESRFPTVCFIWNSENIGFGRACNQALSLARGRYILFLNPDTIVPEDCFHKCLDFMDRQSDAGALGIRMLDGAGRFLPESKRSFPAPLTAFYKLSGLSALFPHSKVFARYHLGHLNEHQDHEVDVLAGAFMLIRKEVLDRTGGFDASFFMYGEDIDLSYRIQQTTLPGTGMRYKNYYFSQSSILHFKGESTRKGTLNYVRLFYLAMSQFVQKHAKGSGSFVFSGMIRFAIWFRAVLSLLRQVLQKAALPFLDALIIYTTYRISKNIWTTYFRPEIIYAEKLLHISFIGFSVLFLIVSYYTGLYQKKFRLAQLVYSSAISLLILLAVYSLLPESIRFSRAIVLFGSFFSFAMLVLWRRILLAIRFIDPAENKAVPYTLVVGRQADGREVNILTSRANPAPDIRGLVSTEPEASSLGTVDQLKTILESVPVRQLILCASERLSYKEIIRLFEQNGDRLQLRIHAAGSKSIVGSDSKEYAGDVIGQPYYKLTDPVRRRLKRLADFLVAVLWILLFPVHFILHPQPLQLLINCLQVLFFQKTWIGYSGDAGGLPLVLPSVLGPAGLPHAQNELPEEGKRQANAWYASEYEVWYDLIMVFSHYKKLGAS